MTQIRNAINIKQEIEQSDGDQSDGGTRLKPNAFFLQRLIGSTERSNARIAQELQQKRQDGVEALKKVATEYGISITIHKNESLGISEEFFDGSEHSSQKFPSDTKKRLLDTCGLLFSSTQSHSLKTPIIHRQLQIIREAIKPSPLSSCLDNPSEPKKIQRSTELASAKKLTKRKTKIVASKTKKKNDSIHFNVQSEVEPGVENHNLARRVFSNLITPNTKRKRQTPNRDRVHDVNGTKSMICKKKKRLKSLSDLN